MQMFQQPHVFMQWTDGKVIDRSFDDERQREQFVSDSVLNDPRIRSVRFYSKAAPAAIRQ
jgi:hypothetical protein